MWRDSRALHLKWGSPVNSSLRALVALLGVAAMSVLVSAQTIAPAALYPAHPGIDVTHYDLSVAVPERGSAIRGVAVLSARRALSVDTLRLDLVGLTVDSVRVNGRTRDVLADSTGVRVPLQARDGTRLQVRVRYHGEPKDGLIVREDSSRGWSAFGDNWPNRARFWIPSVDHPSDKATVAWHVTAPSAKAVIANGVRTSRVRLSTAAARAAALVADDASPEGGWSTTSFVMRQPIPTYLMVIGVADMQETSLGRTACGAVRAMPCVPQSVWTFAPETPTMPGNFREAGRVVAEFSKLVGPFAYERLSHVQSATRFGGMENATAIFYSDRAFRTNSLGVGLIAHETAHQWFGNAVSPRRWADVWLSEGFATYFAALYTQRSRGDSAFLAEMQRIRDAVIAAPIVAERPVVDSVGALTPVTLLNANSYQKGGFVLHMLRTRVGDAAFFGALQNYQRRYRHGTATTDLLRAEFEQRAGTSLSTFFDEWLHRPGWIDGSITWTWNAERHQLQLVVVQGPKFAPRHFVLPLRVRDAAGHERDVSVTLDAKASQVVSLTLSDLTDPTSLVADPRVTVLGRFEVLQAMQ